MCAAGKGNTYWKIAKGFAEGKTPTYKPMELFNKAIEFLQWLETNPLKEEKVFSNGKRCKLSKMRAPTITGFCVYAGIDTSTFNRYENNKNQAYRNITLKIKEIFFTIKLEGSAADLLNPNIISRELGLVDKSENKNENSSVATSILKGKKFAAEKLTQKTDEPSD